MGLTFFLKKYESNAFIFCSDRNCFSLDLMVDEEDCKEAFKLYDKDDSGVIPKDVSNAKPFYILLL